MIEAVHFPPALILFAGAFLLPFLHGTPRHAVALAAPSLTLWSVWLVPDGVALSVPFLEYQLQVVEGDRLSRLFGTIFSIMAFAGGLFAMRQSRTVELSAAYVYAGSAIGVAFASDLITLFVF